MKALRSFTVRPSLPPELVALEELAMNLRWSWDAQTRDVFKWVDPDAWDASVHDPVGVLGVVPRERLDALADDPGFMRFLGEVLQARQPPAKQGHRLKLLYIAQIESNPPRFAIQVNSRKRVTREYAYFIENRLRARYGLDGVPVIIDFVERRERRRAA